MKNLRAPNLNSRFQRHSISLFFIKFFSTIASFLVIYYYSHHLQESDYGTYQSIWTRSFFLNAFAGLGIASLVFTYTPSALKKIFLSISTKKKILLLFIPLACSTLFGLLQTENVFSFFVYFFFFGLYIACNAVETVLGALHQFRWLPFVSLLYALGFCFIHYFVYTTDYKVLSLFAMLLPLLLFRLVVYIALLYSGLKKITVAEEDIGWDSAKIKSLWKHLYFFEASQVVIVYADKFFLSHFLPSSQFAIYFNATISIPFIGLVFSAINNASFLEYAQQQTQEKKIAVLHYTGKILSSVSFPCFFFLFFFSEEIFSILFSDKYLAAVPIFLVTLLALPIRSIYPNTLVLQSNHKGRIINKGVVMDVVASLALAVPLYFLWELKGVALAFVLGTLVQALYYLLASRKVMGVSAIQLIPLKNWAVKFLVFGLGIFILHKILSVFLSPLLILLFGGVIIAVVSLFFLRREFKISSEVKL